jgi:hypothetical protein
METLQKVLGRGGKTNLSSTTYIKCQKEYNIYKTTMGECAPVSSFSDILSEVEISLYPSLKITISYSISCPAWDFV